MAKYLCGFIIAFGLSLGIGAILLPFLQRRHAGQPVLSYVTEHLSKSGTPTMGGFMFLLGIAGAYFIQSGFSKNSGFVCVIIMMAYGIVGFIDDFIKIRSGKNGGLRAYQKIIFQLSIAIIAALYAKQTEWLIPFTNQTIDVGLWRYPIMVFVFLAMTNGVNLTDGLDGLAGKVAVTYLILFLVLLVLGCRMDYLLGLGIDLENGQSLVRLTLCGMGGLMAFLCFNCFPAKIFMGDTGSLGLGGLLASLSILSPYVLFLPIMGIMFVVSCVSVILQVISFKLTKKRIFLMAPYHHHLQHKGIHENRITMIYVCVTAVVGCICLCFVVI